MTALALPRAGEHRVQALAFFRGRAGPENRFRFIEAEGPMHVGAFSKATEARTGPGGATVKRGGSRSPNKP